MSLLIFKFNILPGWCKLEVSFNSWILYSHTPNSACIWSQGIESHTISPVRDLMSILVQPILWFLDGLPVFLEKMVIL